MKSKTWDDAVLSDHRSSIREDSAKSAFDALVAAAIEMPEYETEPAWQGDVRIFKYVDPVSGERPFAFIVNRSDLLFYVRLTGLRRVNGGFGALASQFASASENSRGEWTVRITSKENAERLNALLFAAPTTHERGIPDGITRDDVLGAIRRLDEGVEHGFGPSLKYDLVVEDRRYPPKAVLGLAAERLAGRVLNPSDFSGGQDSKSTRILRELGFVVELKPGQTLAVDAELPEMSNHWWVNHKQTFRQETSGNYLWSPKTNKNGVANGPMTT